MSTATARATLIRRLLVAAAFVAALTACGQKGDLYLPEEPVDAASQRESPDDA